jgi:uncharacterized CHY-type Zn-finger protein
MNRIYIGDRQLEPHEELVMIRCQHCRKSAYSFEWVKNRGCPRCNKPYDGPPDED